MKLFLAIPIPPAVAVVAVPALQRLRVQFPNGRWTFPAQWHLTLKFFGDVPHERVNEIQAALTPLARAERPFQMELNGLGHFAEEGGPWVLWMGVAAGAETFARLADIINATLQPLGFPPDARAVRPHVTLARFGKPLSSFPRLPEPGAPERWGSFQAVGFDLVESRPATQGTEYHRVLGFDFGAAK